METQDLREARELKEVETARTLALTVIGSCLVITLACLAALTIVISAFLLNAPW